MRHRLIRTLAATMLIGLAALTGCGSPGPGPGTAEPGPGQEPEPGTAGVDVYSNLPGDSFVSLTTIGPIPLDPDIAAFMEDCARGVSEWRPAVFSYPRRLEADMGASFSYVAGVDIRNNTPPADREIPQVDLGPKAGWHVEVESIAVKCVLGAELTPVGESLKVDNPGWILREFTPTGVINWSWSVKTIAPNGHDLRLDLRPAVALRDGGDVLAVGDSALQTTTFLTHVEINSSWLVRLDQWWQNNWGVIVSVIGGLGMAVVALIKWGGSFVQALHDARAMTINKRTKESTGPEGAISQSSTDGR